MDILAYNDVDPFDVLQLNLLGRGMVFTPETAAALRRSDPRIFPWLTLNAVEHGTVSGQVGAIRLTMITEETRMNAGGIWGFVFRPDIKPGNHAPALLEQLHERMQLDGLSFSVVMTDPISPAYRLFSRLGYRRLHAPVLAFARWSTAYQPTRLSAGLAGPDGFEVVERLFSELAGEGLGFSQRPSPFPPLRAVNPGHLWVFKEYGEAIGYALAETDQSVMKVGHMVLKQGANTAEAVSALTANIKVSFVQVEVNRPGEIDDLLRAGFRLHRSAVGVLMIRPLIQGLSAADAQSLFAVGTDRFWFSRLDVPGP